MVGTLRDPSYPVDEELKVGARKRPAGAGEMAPPAAPGSDPARAASMQAQMSQPVYKGEAGVKETQRQADLQRGRDFSDAIQHEADRAVASAQDGQFAKTGPRPTSAAEPQQAGAASPGNSDEGKPGVASGMAGGAKTIVGGFALPFAVGVDAARNGVTRLADGDPETLPGGSSYFADAASQTISEGTNQMSEAGQEARVGVRRLLGAQEAKPDAERQAAASRIIASAEAAPAAPGKEKASEPTSMPEAQAPADAAPAAEWQGTGIGQGAQGGEIFMRTGADGVPEFTNETATPGAASGAQPPKAGYGTIRPTQSGAPGNMTAPSGARVLASGSHTPDTEFAALGSAANLGNGVGGFSQNTAGSAALALERFGRANEIRAGTQRPRELGDNGGRVTVVRDSSRGPTIAELQNARLNSRLQQDRIASTDAATRAAEAGQRMDSERINQLNSVADLESKGFSTRAAQRIEKLYEQYDKAKPEDRPAIAEQLRVLSGKSEGSLKDNFIKVKRPIYDAEGRYMSDQEELVDLRGGQSAQQQAQRTDASKFEKGKVYTDANGNQARWDGAQFVAI